MNDIVIDVQNISKKYQITTGYEPDTLREKLVEFAKYPLKALNGTHKTKKKTFWALKNISFQVKRGEVLGIIGKNGAGKSTLLKILSRITEPTDGSITMHGRVASLLEVGTGFNPELTGRENIYLNGAIIGMSRREIDEKINDIIDFSGVREFIDTPVKRYSSGMYVRLAFAVAAHLEADIILLDEVLAVGDTEFQKKCFDKIKNLTVSGKTIILISHNTNAIKDISKNVLYIDSGKSKYYSNTEIGINSYIESYSNPTVNQYVINGDLEPYINILSINDGNKGIFKPEEKILVSIKVKVKKTLKNFNWTCSVYSYEGIRICSTNIPEQYSEFTKKDYVFNFSIKPNTLRPGKYWLAFGGHSEGMNSFVWGENLKTFAVSEEWSRGMKKYDLGLVNNISELEIQ